MPHAKIDKELCSNCGTCASVCPDRIFTRENGQVIVSTDADCLRCWHCIAVCPTGAVSHDAVSTADCPPIQAAALPTLDAQILAFRERRSTRRFAERQVPRELVETLVDSARWTPSASNKQNVDWIAIDDPQQVKALGDAVIAVFQRGADLLRNPLIHLLGPILLGSERYRTAMQYRAGLEHLITAHARGEDPIFHHAPLVLLAHTSAGSELGRDDAIYQAYNLMLVAQRMKLGTCQIGFLTAALGLSVLGLNRPLQQRLSLPAGRVAQVVLVVGFPRVRFHRVVPRRAPDLQWNVIKG